MRNEETFGELPSNVSRGSGSLDDQFITKRLGVNCDVYTVILLEQHNDVRRIEFSLSLTPDSSSEYIHFFMGH